MWHLPDINDEGGRGTEPSSKIILKKWNWWASTWKKGPALSARPKTIFLTGKKRRHYVMCNGGDSISSSYAGNITSLSSKFYRGPRATIAIEKIFRYFPHAASAEREVIISLLKQLQGRTDASTIGLGCKSSLKRFPTYVLRCGSILDSNAFHATN